MKNNRSIFFKYKYRCIGGFTLFLALSFWMVFCGGTLHKSNKQLRHLAQVRSFEKLDCTLSFIALPVLKLSHFKVSEPFDIPLNVERRGDQFSHALNVRAIGLRFEATITFDKSDADLFTVIVNKETTPLIDAFKRKKVIIDKTLHLSKLSDGEVFGDQSEQFFFNVDIKCFRPSNLHQTNDKKTPEWPSLANYRDIFRLLTKVSLKIEEITTDDDALLFLGRSPRWISEVLNIKGSTRRLFNIAYSGWPYTRPRLIPSREQVASFRDYLTRIGVVPEFLMSLESNIIIIDIISTGKSIQGFLHILTTWLLEEGYDLKLIQEKIRIIDLCVLKNWDGILRNKVDGINKKFIYTQEGGIGSLGIVKIKMKNIRHIDVLYDGLYEFLGTQTSHSLGMYYPYKKWNYGIMPENYIPNRRSLVMKDALEDFVLQLDQLDDEIWSMDEVRVHTWESSE